MAIELNRHTVPVPTDRNALFQQRLQLGRV